MHHKYDLIWKDAFYNAHTAAGIYFWKNFTISKEALKMSIFCPLTFPPPLAHISSSFGSYYLLPTQQLAAYTYQFKEEEIWAWGGGNMSRQKSPLCCRLAYGAKFSKINSSGNISDIKGIFWARIMFMVHIPFKLHGKPCTLHCFSCRLHGTFQGFWGWL